ncbi:hypothetical protein [Micromonospora profundi]|uniref:hypothetical protein n=1 Tax=Micromonospora profundi TaxID=1420889 RepID=UPI003647591A
MRRSAVLEQVQVAATFRPPLVTATASPTVPASCCGIGTTVPRGLPEKVRVTSTGTWIGPSWPVWSVAAVGPTVRSTGQKYVDRSPLRQVESAAARVCGVEPTAVERLPT